MIAEVRGELTIYDSHKSMRLQGQGVQDAIARNVDGAILCPVIGDDSSAALLKMHRAGIPVVIVGSSAASGPCLAVVRSDDETGACDVGLALAKTMREHGWPAGEVGLIGMPLSAIGGRARTVGFMRAMDDLPIALAGVVRMRSRTANEAFTIVNEMRAAYPKMRGLFVETASATRGALRAVQGRSDLLLAGFGGEPDLLGMVRDARIAVCGLQQPDMIGRQAAQTILSHLAGRKPQREISVPVLVVTPSSVKQRG